MRALEFCLVILVIYPFASAQNFNLQPPPADYRLREGHLPSDYGYFDGRSPYYGQNYASGYNGPGNVPLSPYGEYPDPYRGNAYGPFSQEPYTPRDFPYGPTPNVNNDFTNNPYPYFINREPNSDPSVFYNAPNNGYEFPRRQYDNYAPTFRTPFEHPAQGPVNPFYQPLPAPIPSESPNVIKEEPDGKHMTVADTLNNQTFLSPEYNYKQIVVADVLPTSDPNAITEEVFGARVPQTNLSEPYNPDIRPFLNPNYPRPFPPNFPSRLPPTEYEKTYPSSQAPFGLNPETPSSFGSDLPNQFGGYPNQGQIPGSTPSSLYPNPPSSVLPDITLSGGPRNIGSPTYPFRSDPSFSENAPRGFPSRGFQIPSSIRPNPTYEAPGHAVSP